jgi:hypothetical protein
VFSHIQVIPIVRVSSLSMCHVMSTLRCSVSEMFADGVGVRHAGDDVDVNQVGDAGDTDEYSGEFQTVC